MAKKALKIANIILRSFSTESPIILLKAFNTYVLPILTYNSTVWSPFSISDQSKLESPLKKFTFRITKLHGFSNRLKLLNIFSIRQHHITRDLCFTYKCINNYYAANSSFFNIAPSNYSSRHHKFRLHKINSKTNSVSRFISNRIVNLWNMLPSNIFESSSLFSFKKMLKNYISTNLSHNYLYT